MRVDLGGIKNQILASMPSEAFELMRPHLRRTEVKRYQLLQEIGQPFDRVYFIESGIAMQLARTRGDGMMEVGVFGRFGLVGAQVVLGMTHAPHRCVMQVAGEAIQMCAGELRLIVAANSIVRQSMLNCLQALMAQHTQSVLCVARHSIRQRLVKMLLFAHDRLDGNVIPLTHDVLATIIGVRRAGISTVLAELEEEGVARRLRGAVEILSRAKLEAVACECYQIVADRYRRRSH